MIPAFLLNRYVLGTIAAFAFLFGLVLFGDHRGYSRAEAEWSTKYDKLVSGTKAASLEETVRQTEANRRARAKAEAAIAALRQTQAARDAAIQETHDQALRDRNAGRECLGADSLRRISKATPGTD